MEFKKMNKKGANTLTGIVIGLLLVIGVFTVAFGFWNEQMENNNAEIPSKYNDTYNQLLESQTSIDDDISAIKDNVNDIEEADENFLAAWNGFKALGSTLLLPISFISESVQVTEVVTGSADFIPSGIKALFIIAIIAIVLFIILSLLTGGNPKI